MEQKLQDIEDFCIKVFLIPCEGYAKKLPNGDCLAYPDPATKDDPVKKGKPWTIGYGSTFDETGAIVKEGDIWSHDKAIAVKKIVLRKFLIELLKYSPVLKNEPIERVAAVLSWYYNLGSGNYRVSTFKKKIDNKEWFQAAEQCKLWDKANGRKLKGLTIRRTLESLYINKTYQ